MGYKKITGRDPRYIAPQTGSAKDRTLSQTARETFATGKNSLSEHSGSAGKKATPGKLQGHGGGS